MKKRAPKMLTRGNRVRAAMKNLRHIPNERPAPQHIPECTFSHLVPAFKDVALL